MTVLAKEMKNLRERVNDPLWRLGNLYQIKDAESGRMIPFEPTSEQWDIIEAIHVHGLTKLLVLKARQLGMSTVINLIMADLMIWNEGFQQSIVDEDQKAASLKLKYKVRVAFESMPQKFKGMFEVVTSNDSEFSVRLKTAKGADQVSTIFAGKNARGGTNQFLHVSEWGPIQHNDPPRSEEIATGALPSAKAGIVVIETTWKGGKGGHLWDLTDRAMTTLPDDLTAEDYRLKFFPWYNDPSYSTDGNFGQIPQSIHDYFAECEGKIARSGKRVVFTPCQKLWYFKVAMMKGTQRFAEFPTTLDECFKSPVEGAVYAALMDQALAEGRIMDFPRSHSDLVFTTWDLGSPKNTRTIYWQFVGREIHCIDHDTDLNFSPVERVAHILAKGYPYGGHFFPHDAAAEEKAGMNFQQQMRAAGLEGIRIIPRCHDIWPGVNKAAELMPMMLFHKTRCAALIESLLSYHTKVDRSKPGVHTDLVVHDWSSHDADALRMLAEAMMAGFVKGAAEVIRHERMAHQRPKKASGGRWRG